MKYNMLELLAGDGQMVIVYLSHEDPVFEVGALANAVAEDAALRLKGGWRLLSVGSLPIGQSGQSNFLAVSTGQHTTQAALIATYSRLPE